MSKRRRADRASRTSQPDRPAAVSPGAEAAVPAISQPQARDAAVAKLPASSIAAVAGGITALALYIVTLAPTVATGDSGELATVAATLGLAHPPGYPTFTLLGHAATWLPIGDAAYRVNLLSAVLNALAVGLTVLVAADLIRASRVATPSTPPRPREHRPRAPAGLVSDPAATSAPGGLDGIAIALAGLAAGLSLALSTAFWRYSLVAEVFALNNVLAVAMLLLMLRWSRQPERMSRLWLAALLAGVSLTNQQTIVFVAPALLVLLVAGVQRVTAPRPGRQQGPPVPWRQIGIAVGFGVLGLLPYAYLPIAAAAGADPVWGDPTSPLGLLGIILRTAYGTFSLTVRDTTGDQIEHIGLFAGYLVGAFSPVGIGLAVVGTWWLAIRRGSEALALGLWFLVAGPVFLVIANPPLTDPVTRGVLERFYILPSIPVALSLGLGAWRSATWVAEQAPIPTTSRSALVTAALAIAIGSLGVLAGLRLPLVDESQNRVAEAYADDILEGLPQGALLLMRSDEHYTSITYAQQVRGVRTDVLAVDVELLKIESYVRVVERRHPELDVPFEAYDGGERTKLAHLVAGEMPERDVFLVGEIEEDLEATFDLVDEGLTERVLPNGEAPDHLAALRADPTRIVRLHPPTRRYPATSWEAAIAARYADVAFESGVALQELGPQANWEQVRDLYRRAIDIDPDLASAYKNLGLLIQTNAGPASEIIEAWERYLVLRPDDPEASLIQAAIDGYKAGEVPSLPPAASPTAIPSPS